MKSKYTIAILAVLAVPHFAFGEEEDKGVERDEKVREIITPTHPAEFTTLHGCIPSLRFTTNGEFEFALPLRTR